MTRVLALRTAEQHHLLDDLRHRVRRGADAPCTGCTRENASGTSPSAAFRREASGMSCSTGISVLPRTSISRSLAKYMGTIGMFSSVNVLPHIQLGPVRKWKHANAFALIDAAVKQGPKLGTLVLRIPLTEGIAEREDPFLRSRLLLIAARAAKSRVVTAGFERVQQRAGLQRAAAALWCRPERLRAVG